MKRGNQRGMEIFRGEKLSEPAGSNPTYTDHIVSEHGQSCAAEARIPCWILQFIDGLG